MHTTRLLLLTLVIAAPRLSIADDPRSDARLEAVLLTLYSVNEHLNPFRLEADVKNGIAVLGGTVNSPIERELAVSIARQVDGVLAVVDQLEVLPLAPRDETRKRVADGVSDSNVDAMVRFQLDSDRVTSGLSLRVSTEDSVVRIGGEIPSAASARAVRRMARHTKGVSAVTTPDLVIVPGTERAAPDALGDPELLRAVRGIVSFDRRLDGVELEVSVREGAVILTGTVVDPSQLLLLHERITAIRGVTAIEMHTVVEKRV